MSWYWILFIVLVYLIIGAIVIGFISRIFKPSDNAIPALLFTIPIWPLVGFGALLMIIVIFIADWNEIHTPKKEKEKHKEKDINLKDL